MSELEQLNHKVPDDWLAVIIHYVMGMQNETHDFSEPILKPVVAKIYPLFVIQYSVLAIFGIVTNLAIIVYIMRYKLYRDATHAFIVNLAFCHFVQCAIELPITLMVLLIQNWIFGQFWCFFLPLLQDIPLHVAMITHLLIAWDRMRWLGDPIKTRIPTFVCSCATWLTGMVIALPYPIYTTYLDLGQYLKQFRGVGICAVNLVDDMQEYMRGLFVLMYCAPTTILAYLYIRTARELRPPDNPIAVMMFEARAEARNRTRTSSSSSGRPIRTNSNRSYDLYDAELDVTREKRTQRHLGAMAATQVICVCPVMIMKLARMAITETYDNAAHFDITYLMFVWIAFLPTVIVPWIYASWVLSRPAKERLKGYFRLSTRRSEKISKKLGGGAVVGPGEQQQNDLNEKIINENVITSKTALTSVTTTNPSSTPTIEGNSSRTSTKKDYKKHLHGGSGGGGGGGGGSGVKGNENNGSLRDNEHDRNLANLKTISELNKKTKGKHKDGYIGRGSVGDDGDGGKRTRNDHILDSLFCKHASLDPLSNSCSNITSSTYCNIGTERTDDTDNASSIFNDSCYDTKPLCDRTAEDPYQHRVSLKKAFNRNIDALGRNGERDFSPKGSTTTLERDLEIIDMLERERSMDIQEMIAKERKAEQLNISRQGSMMERRRKLPEPDFTKISSNINAKLTNMKEQQFAKRYSPTGAMRERSYEEITTTPVPLELSRKNSRNSYVNRDSFSGASVEFEPPIDPRILEHRLNRQRGSGSSRGSTNSRERRYSGKEYRNTGDIQTYTDEDL